MVGCAINFCSNLTFEQTLTKLALLLDAVKKIHFWIFIAATAPTAHTIARAWKLTFCYYIYNKNATKTNTVTLHDYFSKNKKENQRKSYLKGIMHQFTYIVSWLSSSIGYKVLYLQETNGSFFSVHDRDP